MLIKGFTIIPSDGDIEAGIYIYYNSYNCTVMDNVIANFSEAVSYYGNRYGLLLEGSWNCRILGNAFVNDGLMVSDSYGNVVENNVVNGKPLVYLENRSNVAVDNAGQVILVNCKGIRVENLDLSSSTIGVELWETDNAEIIGNNITNSYYGSYLHMSSNNSIVGNSIANNGYGIYAFQSSNNSFSGNNVANSVWWGIYFGYSSNNTVAKNHITNNYIGVRVFAREYMSSDNIIYGNNITKNSYGVYCSESINNTFYHNNFIDNTYYQAYPVGYAQIWDNSCQGNYWSNYTGADSDGDGIGDTPYFIDANNQDSYPLMSPYIVGDINHDGIVDGSDLSIFSKAYGSKSGDDSWNCCCDLNRDSIIDASDLFDLSKNYGKTA